MTENKTDYIGCIAAALALAIAPFTYILNGWALTILWRWFVVPTFGAPRLSIPVAIGISIITGFLTYRAPSPTKDNEEVAIKNLNAALLSIVHPLICLGIGWIVTLFMA